MGWQVPSRQQNDRRRSAGRRRFLLYDCPAKPDSKWTHSCRRLQSGSHRPTGRFGQNPVTLGLPCRPYQRSRSDPSGSNQREYTSAENEERRAERHRYAAEVNEKYGRARGDRGQRKDESPIEPARTQVKHQRGTAGR